MDVAVSNDDQTVCLVGALGIFYGQTGPTFWAANPQSVPWNSMVSQNVRPFGNSDFAVVGRFTNNQGTSNGVAVSSSGPGGSWTVHDIAGLSEQDGYYARYGSFPSATTWYVSMGNWPHETDAKLENWSVVRVSSRLSVTFNVLNEGVPLIQFMSARHLQGTFPGAIAKTTDGGHTWTKVFDSNGQFYFNQIDCFDVNNCFAVGENMKSAVILKTTDGGANWANVMTLNGPKSLHAVTMISDSEIWVTGGQPSVGQFQFKDWVGTYFHSIDGGATWTETSYNGYGFDMAWEGGVGYSSALFKGHADMWTYTQSQQS